MKRTEFEIISKLFAPLSASYPGALGLKDDAGILKISEGCYSINTVDTLVSGIHFLPETDAAYVASKLVRVNMSDLAAMGAKPKGVLISISLPVNFDERWVTRFAQGLAKEMAEFSIVLIGGDTVTTTGPLTLSLTAIGEVAVTKELRRSDARVGDTIYVSGTIGDSALGLKVEKRKIVGLDSEYAEYLSWRYNTPLPRVTLGQRLGDVANACVDISDGLCADIGHICTASRVGAIIDANAIPISPAASVVISQYPDLFSDVLSGGDDYELAFTVPQHKTSIVEYACKDMGLPVTAIGKIVHKEDLADYEYGVKVVDVNGEDITPQNLGYKHF
ncbi:MAG: thiamine-phosphate kinase [Alphaproteobacteria bacterium]|nr:thiamine-phosphate kinase [Alphaproteobacteria bacterium]